MSEAELAAMAEEATVDAYGEDEQAMDFHTMIADNLKSIVATCARDRVRQAIRAVDLPFLEPPPAGTRQ